MALADAEAAVGFKERFKGPSPPEAPPVAATSDDIVVMLTESSVDLGMTKVSLGWAETEEPLAGILVISTRSTPSPLREDFLPPKPPPLLPPLPPLAVFFRSMVSPGGNAVEEAAPPPAAAAAVAASTAATAGDGSSEMVFLRPRFVVPGTLGPVDDDVYLMISVSEGSRRESPAEGLDWAAGWAAAAAAAASSCS